ncbi:hypothetical protein [Leptospira interrogans]
MLSKGIDLKTVLEITGLSEKILKEHGVLLFRFQITWFGVRNSLYKT